MNSQVHHMLDSHSHVTEFADQVETASKGTQMSRQIATQVLAKDKGMQCIEYSMLCNVVSHTLCVCVHIFGTCIIFNVLYKKEIEILTCGLASAWVTQSHSVSI